MNNCSFFPTFRNIWRNRRDIISHVYWYWFNCADSLLGFLEALAGHSDNDPKEEWDDFLYFFKKALRYPWYGIVFRKSDYMFRLDCLRKRASSISHLSVNYSEFSDPALFVRVCAFEQLCNYVDNVLFADCAKDLSYNDKLKMALNYVSKERALYANDESFIQDEMNRRMEAFENMLFVYFWYTEHMTSVDWETRLCKHPFGEEKSCASLMFEAFTMHMEDL